MIRFFLGGQDGRSLLPQRAMAGSLLLTLVAVTDGCDLDGWDLDLKACTPPPSGDATIVWSEPTTHDTDGDCWDDEAEIQCLSDLSRDADLYPGGKEIPGNGRDDNCDGDVDRCRPDRDCDLDGVSENDGDCSALVPTSFPGATELCNGLDDDCDGQIDEGDPESGAHCMADANGVCEAGIEHCVNGRILCKPGDPTMEVCDGLDNDCDGAVDDGNPGGGGNCTASDVKGACQNGTWVCIGGAPSCVPGKPAAETCNGLDDDCDGVDDNVIGGILKVPFLVNCGAGASFSVSLPSPPGCKFLSVPVVLEYPGIGVDPDIALDWSVSTSTSTISGSCSAGSGALRGYLAVAAIPSDPDVARTLPAPKSLAAPTASVSGKTCRWGPDVSISPLKQGELDSLRIGALRKLEAKGSLDLRWYSDLAWDSALNTQARIWLDGGELATLSMDIVQLWLGPDSKYKQIEQAVACAKGNGGTTTFSLSKTLGKKALPLISIATKRDAEAPNFICNSNPAPIACSSNPGSSNGYFITISGDDDPSVTSVVFNVTSTSNNEQDQVYFRAALLEVP